MATSTNLLAPIESALDRFREAHYWIHTLEQNYHHADPFRWHFNSFLKSIKEVPSLVSMGLQNRKGFSSWFKPQRERLTSDPLMNYLATQRDFVVHRGMLVPSSKGSIGITEGRGFKLGLTFPVHPLEDSDDAMHRYLHYVLEHNDFLQILMPDDDSLPCIHREWRLPNFEQELVELAAQAWLRTGETVNKVVAWLGPEPPELSLSCRHSSQQVQFKVFDRIILNKQLRQMRKDMRAAKA
jgi:hypothetical protein